MINWIIIWIVLFLILVLLVLMEVINGSIEARFWVCIIILFILAISPILVIGEYNKSIEFYNEYTSLARNTTNLTQGQESMVFGKVLNYNYYLYQYQNKINHFGIFSPYTKDIQQLEPIKLNYFDIDKYKWWD